MEEEKDKQNTQPLRDSAKIMLDWIQPIRGLAANDFQAIVLAIVDFECYGREADFSKANDKVKMAWSFIAPQIKRMSDHYNEIAERNRVNGNKGGRPRKASNNEDYADSSEEEPPNPNNPNGFSNNPKNPSGLSQNPKNPIIEEKKREDNKKENKSQDKEREGKSSAPFDEEGAYSPSSLMKFFNFISPSFAPSFSKWIQYLNRKDRKLVPKTAEAYKAQYDRLVSLSKKDPYIANLIVEDCTINHHYTRLYNNLNPRDLAIREANRRDRIAAGLDPDAEPTTYGSDHEF